MSAFATEIKSTILHLQSMQNANTGKLEGGKIGRRKNIQVEVKAASFKAKVDNPGNISLKEFIPFCAVPTWTECEL